MATALLISTDGHVTSVDIDPNDFRALRAELEAEAIDVVQLGTIDVVVDDFGRGDGRPLNPVATALVARFGHPYPIHGPVLLLGYPGVGDESAGLDAERLTELAGYGIAPG